jgi:4-amino-4-deoxy-L-arabinose transferase-like glycosyltransferase
MTSDSIETTRFSNYNRLIIAYLAAFSLIPMITRNIIPYDMIENLYWGKELQLGYAKHPPLFAWISYFFYRCFFSCPESLYILTQLNLLLGFYFIFQTAKLIFSDKTKSYASVMIFMASVCSVFGNEKFNASTILMSLLPATYYFFIRLLKFNKISDALWLGVFSALAFLGKYVALLHLGCLGVFVILHRECWKLLRTPPFYWAAIVFAVGVSWHLLWIADNDFITLKYALDKSVNNPPNYFSAWNFLMMQCVFFATSFWAFSYSCSGKMRIVPKDNYNLEEKFIIFITLAPNGLLFLISAATGMRIGSFWGTNMLMFLGIYLLIVNRNFDMNRLASFVKKISIFFAAILFLKLGIARYLLCEYDPTNAVDIRKIAREIDADWKNKFGSQKMKILKTDKAMAALHIHLQDSPSSYDARRRDLFRIYDGYPPNETVALAFLCRLNGDEIKRFKNLYGKNILWENMTRVINDFFVYYAFVNLASDYEKTGS